MKQPLTDTTLKAEHVQIELFRNASVAKRVSLARSLSQSTLQLARRAIRRAHPEASSEEVDVMFVTIHYGQELADRLRQQLNRRRG